jgi:hypothetical protein
VRRHGRSRAFAANQSSNAATSFEFLVFGFEFKNLPNREIHEIREKEMKNLAFDLHFSNLDGFGHLLNHPLVSKYA